MTMAFSPSTCLALCLPVLAGLALPAYGEGQATAPDIPQPRKSMMCTPGDECWESGADEEFTLLQLRAGRDGASSAVPIRVSTSPPGTSPKTCWAVAGKGGYDLVLAACDTGAKTQAFELHDYHTIVWTGHEPQLCLEATQWWAGFTTCKGGQSSQTFQLPGYSWGPVCQCSCTRFGPCPIPCTDAPCLKANGAVHQQLASSNETWFQVLS